MRLSVSIGWIKIAILNLIIPFVMLLTGGILKRNPVWDRGSHNGYNTPTSRRSQESWNYAQVIAPGIFVSYGKGGLLAEAVLTGSLLMMKAGEPASLAVGAVLGLLIMTGAFLRTEKAIKDKCDK